MNDPSPGPTHDSVTVGGLRIGYTDWGGPGRDIVLLHGLRGCRRSWDLVGPILAKRFRMLAPDIRGHGDSDGPDHGYGPSSLAADLRGFLDRLGVSDPLLVGHSFGALVSSEYAGAYPEAVAGVVILDGLFPPSPPPEMRDRALEYFAQSHVDGATIEELRAGLAAAPVGKFISPEMETVMLRCYDSLPDGTWRHKLSFANMSRILAALWDHDRPTMLSAIRCPVLIMPARGDDDDNTLGDDDEKAARVAEARGLLDRSKVVWIENSTHSVTVQHPEFIAAVIEQTVDEGYFGPVGRD